MATGSSYPPANLPAAGPDVLIAGAGIIGLSLALELHSRGASVLVLERDTALSHASTAAAGMLAVHDPQNPPALLPLSELSAQLYPAFLARVEKLSGIAVPFHTETTLQYHRNGIVERLAEHSLDPHQLAAALLAAVRATSIELREHTPVEMVINAGSNGATLASRQQEGFRGDHVVIAAGAWAAPLTSSPIAPRKGQMLQIALPQSLHNLHEVHRSNEIYIVPRTLGPQAGTALLGATIEDAGFDTSTHYSDLATLRTLAAKLLPALASEKDAPQLAAWAGLRPHTPDRLPVLGHSEPSNHPFLATGHYRNGILLAPATAALLADLIEGKSPAIDLTPFSPARFSRS